MFNASVVRVVFPVDLFIKIATKYGSTFCLFVLTAFPFLVFVASVHPINVLKIPESKHSFFCLVYLG